MDAKNKPDPVQPLVESLQVAYVDLDFFAGVYGEPPEGTTPERVERVKKRINKLKYELLAVLPKHMEELDKELYG